MYIQSVAHLAYSRFSRGNATTARMAKAASCSSQTSRENPDNFYSAGIRVSPRLLWRQGGGVYCVRRSRLRLPINVAPAWKDDKRNADRSPYDVYPANASRRHIVILPLKPKSPVCVVTPGTKNKLAVSGQCGDFGGTSPSRRQNSETSLAGGREPIVSPAGQYGRFYAFEVKRKATHSAKVSDTLACPAQLTGDGTLPLQLGPNEEHTGAQVLH